jgi:leucyl aminopeptidase
MIMEMRVERGRAELLPCGLLLLFSFDSPDEWEGSIRDVDSEWKGFLSSLMKKGDFKGELYQCQLFYTQGSLPAQRVLLTGLGKKGEFDLEKWRGASAKAGRYIRDSGIKQFAFPIKKIGVFSEDQLAEAFVTGLLLGVYQFNELKTLERDKIKEIEEGVLLGENSEEA